MSWVQDLSKKKFGKGQFSQGGQDHILKFILDNISVRQFCVEFGFNSGSLTCGSGANCANLVVNDNWDCVLFDGSNSNPEINLYREYLTSKNIVDVFRKYSVPDDPGYISIDIDSMDLWIFEALLKEYKSAIYSVEYNCHFPIEHAITLWDDPAFLHAGDRGYGASLRALHMLALRYGYILVAVEKYLDLFFVREDLVDSIPPLSTWEEFAGINCHLPLKDKSIVNKFIDFEYWTETGDLEKSRLKALGPCERYLC